jgi:hypothetical protein
MDTWEAYLSAVFVRTGNIHVSRLRKNVRAVGITR